MEIIKKYLQKAAIVGFVLAALCLLFAACPDTQENPDQDTIIDKTALKAAIDEANDLLDSVESSDNDGINLPAGTIYAATGDWDNFQTAIQAAQAVYGNSSVTQKQIDDTVTALEAAQSFFESKVKSRKAAKPVADPAPGSVAYGTMVTLTTEIADAAIYFTTDGSTPTAASTRYTGAITIIESVTIKAIANLESGDYANSDILEASYTIMSQTATPVANPSGGEVTSGTTVVLTTATVGAAIYYTTDGSTPTAASTKYTVPIEITEAVIIKAIAVMGGYVDSEVLEASYTIGASDEPYEPYDPIDLTVYRTHFQNERLAWLIPEGDYYTVLGWGSDGFRENMRGVPAGDSYMRMEFVIDPAKPRHDLNDDYITFFIRGRDQAPIFLTFVYITMIEPNTLEAFIPMSQLHAFLRDNPLNAGEDYAFGYNNVPVEDRNPTFNPDSTAENEGVPQKWGMVIQPWITWAWYYDDGKWTNGIPAF